MEKQLDALREVKEFLDRHHLRYIVIGGVANLIWGQPRATQDADFKVMLDQHTIADIVALLGSRFRFRVAGPLGFAQQTYVLPIYASNEVGVDIGLGFFAYEQEAVDKAVVVEYRGVTFPVCTAEDLIIHKAISEREKDWSDIEGVLLRQGSKLNQKYIAYWLEQFVQVLERPEIVKRYSDLRKKLARKKRK